MPSTKAIKDRKAKAAKAADAPAAPPAEPVGTPEQKPYVPEEHFTGSQIEGPIYEFEIRDTRLIKPALILS